MFARPIAVKNSLAFAIIGVLASQAALAFDYSVIDIGGNANFNLGAMKGINESGQVAFSLMDSYAARATLWSSGTTSDLGALPNTVWTANGTSYANSINDSGQIVGVSYVGVSAHATLYTAGGVTDLGTLNPTAKNTDSGLSYANGINKAGQIVGQADFDGSYAHATIWLQGQAFDIAPSNGFWSGANAINNIGQVVGFVGYYQSRATLWSNILCSQEASLAQPNVCSASITDLGMLSEARESTAMAVNDKGQVVGYSIRVGSSYHDEATEWTDGKIVDLGSLFGGGSRAYGVNTAGDVVGYSNIIAGGIAATLWKNGVPINLNSTIDPSLGIDLVEATAINDHGQIVGQARVGSSFHTVLLTPTAVSEPSSSAMLLAGLLAGVLLFARQRPSVGSR